MEGSYPHRGGVLKPWEAFLVFPGLPIAAMAIHWLVGVLG